MLLHYIFVLAGGTGDQMPQKASNYQELLITFEAIATSSELAHFMTIRIEFKCGPYVFVFADADIKRKDFDLINSN